MAVRFSRKYCLQGIYNPGIPGIGRYAPPSTLHFLIPRFEERKQLGRIYIF